MTVPREKHDAKILPPLNDLAEMVPGWGYWIRVSLDCGWTVE